MKTMNLTKIDIALRLTIGAAMLALFLMDPEKYTNLAALATYPILTALMVWDPFYALFEYVASKFSEGGIHTTHKKHA